MSGRLWPGASLRLKVLVTVLAISALVAGSAGTLLLRQGEATLERAFEHRARSLCRTLARNATFGVLSGSRPVLRDLLHNLLQEEDVRWVQVLDRHGVALAAAGEPGGLPGERVRTVEAPVQLDRHREQLDDDEFAIFQQQGQDQPPAAPGVEQIGVVRLTASEAGLQQALAAVRWQSAAWTATLALAGALLAWLFVSSFLAPLRQLVQSVEAVGRGELQPKVPEPGDRELLMLASALNRMTAALRQHQEELERTYRELAARERLACIGQMTAAVAHELRNPLGILLSSAQVVANPQRSPAQRAEAASFILDEVRRLDRTLAGFLEFARPRPPRLESLELPPLVRRALQTAAQHEQAKGVAFELILPEAGELPHVEADPDRLLQALLNLLLNACQAVGSAGGRVWLRLSVGRGEAGAPGFVAITVEDDGPGIPEELAGKVGEPFFTTRAEGMGLGLAIVRQTAQAHGGVLEIGRAAAGGAAVRLRLPLAGDRACAAPAAAVDEEERERGCGSAAARLGKEDEHDGSHDEPTNPG